jgi:hypothetical protein
MPMNAAAAVARPERFAEKALGRVDVVLCCEQEVDWISMLVDRAVQIAPLPRILT